MTIMLTENVSPSVRGELSKWMVEIKAGVFIGKINALVRDELWRLFISKLQEKGSLIQIWNTNNEQGFDLRYHNLKNYTPVDMEGIWLVKKS